MVPTGMFDDWTECGENRKFGSVRFRVSSLLMQANAETRSMVEAV